MNRVVLLSPMLLALLFPAVLQPLSCKPSETPDLVSLEVEVAGLNRIVGFDSSTGVYSVWTPDSAGTMIVRAQPVVPTAVVTYRLFPAPVVDWQDPIASGSLDSEATISIPPGPVTLRINVDDGGAFGNYTVDINLPCSVGECDDADPCTNDVCNGSMCEFTPQQVCGESRPVGLYGRPDNTSCVAPTRVVSSGPIEWQPAAWGSAPGLNLMMMRQLPDGTWLEIYREGSVYAIDGAQQRVGPLLTIGVSTEGEMGLLGFAVDPDWPTMPYLYFYYTTLPGNGHIHIDRYTADPSGATPTIDAGSRVEIFDFDRGVPWTNHVGGTIEFDPNAATPTLYAAMGDAENQPEAQNPASYYGALLRFDVDSPPYTPEVVGIGLRNPFRWSFDSETGDLWIADVGDASREEVNRVPAASIPGPGGTPINFGWPIMEGFECRTGSDPANSCGHSSPLMLPIHDYGHGVGVSVIGGRVYRGQAIVGLDGTYVFNDIFVQNGEGTWTLQPNPNEDPAVIDDDYTRTVIPGPGGGFVGFTEDNQGELYGFVTWGEIYKLGVAAGGEPQDPLPSALSDTGCFDAGGAAAAALIPYDLQTPLWSDAATKRRWLALPNNTQATLDARGDFAFPNGTVLAKEFTIDGVRVETRLFMRHPDGVWAGYSYAWVADDGSVLVDGELLPDTVVTRAVAGTGKTWTFPSRNQCTACHTAQTGGSLGIEAGHLNTDYTYGGTGITANQLYTLSEIGIVGGDITRFGDRAYPAYDDDTASLDDRVWAYLNSNCAGCHQPGATGMSGRSQVPDLRYDLLHDTLPGEVHPLAASLCDVASGAGDIGLGLNAPLVVPGNPGDWSDLGSYGSVLYLRMAARPNVPGSTGAMPQLGSAEVDDVNGLPLMSEWITTLTCD